MEAKPASTTYKWCIVPMCTNTSFKTPEKVFVYVPRDETRRKEWLRAVRRDDSARPLSKSSMMFCCQDHFNLEEDMENWIRFSLVGGRLKSKKDVVPHIFDCQRRRFASTTNERSAAKKRRIHSTVQDAIDNQLHVVMNEDNQCNSAAKIETVTCPSDESVTLEENGGNTSNSVREIGTQVQKIGYRSKSTMCNLPTVCQPLINTATSPIKFVIPEHNEKAPSTSTGKCFREQLDLLSEDGEDNEEESDEYIGHSDDLSEETSDVEVAKCNEMRKLSLKMTKHLIQSYPRQYLGVPLSCYFVIETIANKLPFCGKWASSVDVVLLILRKIRLNESFLILGNSFGLSESQTARLFSKFVPLVAQCMKELIVWPSKETIQQTLPITFRARYSNVQSIIDCFEIEIEKPCNAVHQALTWSDYKKANTLKYLISITPDGIINFLSEGYGGRASDVVILEESGYLNFLSKGMGVMADRGFKHVQQAIQSKDCFLVRPPSVAHDEKLSAEDCKETKRIASLRIHVERCIRRIREFKFLVPHSCVNNHLVPLVDYAVQIAGGLVNMQPPLIK